MVDVTESINVDGVDEDGNLFYGDHSSEGGHVSRYQCLTCGEPIVADNGLSRPQNPEALVAWLSEHNML
jgi:hypothetical protein